MIELGKEGRDKITGFTGIITAKAEYLYGCTQYVLVPTSVDNKLGESEWFDEGRIEVIGKGITKESVVAEKPGGPQRDMPTRRT